MILKNQEIGSAGPIVGTGEGVARPKRWYVAMVRMHHEKKVAEKLGKLGIECFVPVREEYQLWHNRIKEVCGIKGPLEGFKSELIISKLIWCENI